MKQKIKFIILSSLLGLCFMSFVSIRPAFANFDFCKSALEMLQFGSIEGEGFRHIYALNGKHLSENEKTELLKHAGKYLAQLEAHGQISSDALVARTQEAVEHILGRERLNEGLKVVLTEYQASKQQLASGVTKSKERNLSNVSVELLNSSGETRNKLISEFQTLVDSFLKNRPTKDTMDEEGFMYDVVWDISEKKDHSPAARQLLKTLGHISTNLKIMNTKIVAGAAYLRLDPKNEDAYMSLHAMYRAMLPASDDLAKMLGVPTEHDPSLNPLIEIAFEALQFAKSQGNPVAEDIRRTKIEISDKKDGPFKPIKTDDDWEP